MFTTLGLLVQSAALFALVSQGPPVTATPDTGRLVEKVACPSDPTQTYTLYLPAAYTTGRRWPLLFVFDPRGRGTLAAEIFREAAEKYGWIIASSDNTQSDTTWEPNQKAIAAMWPDVLNGYAVDPKRIYAAGFSGGATVAWVLGRETGAIAGVIASGAPNPGTESPKPVKLAWFGSAGDADFNYLDAKEIDARMVKAGNPHRIEYFKAPHSWLPKDLAMRGVGWLEVLAMKDGLRVKDAAVAGALFEREMELARGLESAGDLVAAERAYTSLVESYAGVLDVAPARERATALQASDAFTRATRDEERIDRRERKRMGEFGAVLVQFMRDDISTVPELRAALKIEPLKREAAGAGYAAASARRTLEHIYVQVAFYVWRQYEEKKDYAHAALSMEMATAIHPERPGVWINLAGDRAMSGSKGAAIDALERAVEAGYRDGGALESDARFESLRKSPEFVALVQKLKGSAGDEPAE